MKLVNRKTGAVVDVAEGDVPSYAKTGMWALPAGATLPVALPSGATGTVAAADAMQALSGGATVPTPAEYHAAQQAERFGGPGGTAAAAGVGALRGAGMAFGLPTDESLVDAARAFGSYSPETDPYSGTRMVSPAERMRALLGGLQEEHPYASQAGELAGMVGAGLVGETPLGALGAAAEEALPAGLGRLARGVVRGAAEGAPMGAISTFNEAALGDTHANAEKVVAGMGHGAFLGAGLGAAFSGLGVAKDAARDGLGRFAGKLVPKDIESLAEKTFGYAPEGLGERVQKAYSKLSAGAAGKDVDVVEKFTSLSPEGAEVRRIGVFDAPKIQDAAERDIRTHVDEMLRSGDLVSAEARGQLKADHVDRAIRKGNEAETRAYTAEQLDKLIAGAEYQLAHAEGVAPQMKKALGTVRELAERARAVAEKTETVNYAPFIDADAGLDGDSAIHKPFAIGEELRPVQLRPGGRVGKIAAEEPISFTGRKTLDLDAGLRGTTTVDDPFAIEGPASGLDSIIARIDREGRHSGLVPLSKLRTAFPDMGRSEFDDMLLAAERDGLLDLKTINDPKLAKADLLEGGIKRTDGGSGKGRTSGWAVLREEPSGGGVRLADDAMSFGKGRATVPSTKTAYEVGLRGELEPGKIPTEEAFRLSSAKEVPRRVEMKDVDAEHVGTGTKKPIGFEHITQPKTDNAQLFVELDNLKRAVQRIARTGNRSVVNIADPLEQMNARRAVDWFAGAASELRAGLEDEALWGRAATDQRTINAAWTKQLDAAERFHRALTTETSRDPSNPYRRIRGADPARVATYVKNLTNPNNDLTHAAVKDFVSSSRELAGAIHTSYDLPPEKIAEVERVAAAAKGFERTVTKAESALVTANQFRALTEGTTDSLSAILGTVGGAFGGLPGGIIGAAAGAVANPGRVVAQLASVERLITKVDARLGSSVRDFFSGKSRRPTALHPAATPEGFDATVKLLSESVDLEGNITPSGRQKIAEAIGDLGEGAPQLAVAVGMKAMQIATFLAGKVPVGMRNPYEMFPGDEPPLVSETERETFARYVQAAEDPMSVIDHLARGTVTPEEADVLKNCYPRMYDQVRAKIDAAAREGQAKGKPLEYEPRVAYGVLFQVRTDATMDPAVLQAVESARAERGTRRGGGGGFAKPAHLKPIPGFAPRFQTAFGAAATSSRRKGGLL